LQLNKIGGILLKYNEQQQKAVDAHKGAFGVVASPGAGKSTVLVGRIDNLIRNHNVLENEILAISFTRNTADELKSKLTNWIISM